MSGWKFLADVIDIAIVAFIIYQLLLLLRGRRAMGMLVSLFAIVVIGFIARWLKLDALNWLMSGLKGIWAIIFVILFQEEIRRLLEAQEQAYQHSTAEIRARLAALEATPTRSAPV